MCVCDGETFTSLSLRANVFSPILRSGLAVHLGLPLPRSAAESDSPRQTVMDVSEGPSDGVSIEALRSDLAST